MAEIYPERNTLTLRQEALNRVREMQRRAQLMTEQQNSSPTEESSIAADADGDKRMNEGHVNSANNFRQPQRGGGAQMPNILGQLFGQRPPPAQQNTAAPGGIADLLRRQGFSEKIGGLGETVQNTVSSVSQPAAQLLESFGIDGEKLIILMVMWAVFNQNKENKTLLMALGYLLL